MWKTVEQLLVAFGNHAWGYPLLFLLVGGGIFLTLYSRFLPFRYFKHAVDVLRGKFDNPDDPGDVSHFQALSSALASTIGMGNISGVAVAIALGGPGVLFWMWMSAFIGMATKFFTCTLAVMFRGKDSEGQVQGGPMYVIEEGLGKKWKPLALFFCLAGIFGASPLFNANQLTQLLRDVLFINSGVVSARSFGLDITIGLSLLVLVSLVVFGGIKRIAQVASKLVPAMVVLYLLCVAYILFVNIELVPSTFVLIFEDAFSAKAMLGGAVGAIIVAGIRRAAFSNEAGIGTAPMAHGAAKTTEPVREGLVAMLGPAIDTLVVCTLTALAILVTGAWQDGSVSGVSMTLKAFEMAMPGIGSYLLLSCVSIFAITSLFAYSYYGTKCLSYVTNVRFGRFYNHFHVVCIVIGAVSSITAVLSLIDGMFALMAVPTMISTLLLSPKVMKAAKVYFAKQRDGELIPMQKKRVFVKS
ncbi:alanine/glycine:cation symporter family protein [Xanthovirga aplysinae]|uniref:alanine/glycine:cation symporter family protein n=1 Tax=Xanthovirga aplysinae TaxID=2529853 RepID=UPI0012BD708E|nr:alanine/glycine:cation symporter family protein [Xanthovirga aplysinae]MTI31062.1 alanine:cation symporter family protein [Xanthovirga aplysinae]